MPCQVPWFLVVERHLMHHSNSASGAAPQQWSRRSRRGTRPFLFQSIWIHLNCASGAAPRHGVAAPYGAPDPFFSIYLLKLYWIVNQMPLHSRQSQRQTGHQTSAAATPLLWSGTWCTIWIDNNKNNKKNNKQSKKSGVPSAGVTPHCELAPDAWFK